MKKRLITMARLLVCALPFCLAACRQEPTAPPPENCTQPETTNPARLDEPDFVVRREVEEITLHPFTQEEFAAAVEAVRSNQEDAAGEAGVLTYRVERIAYDPVLTDVHIRQKMARRSRGGLDGGGLLPAAD